MHRRVRPTGQFDYRVSLPTDVDADQVQAELNEGVLTVHVPKSAKAPAKQIEIKGQ